MRVIDPLLFCPGDQSIVFDRLEHSPATELVLGALGVARLPLFGNFSYSAIFFHLID
jgi:hypothetical protein